MSKKKKKPKLNKSNYLENMFFAHYEGYNPNKKKQLCQTFFDKDWSELTGIELNKLVFFGQSMDSILEHYGVSTHQFLDKLRRE
ncbi:MAG: hypothetical protein VW378_00735 [bacterium]